ncbi:MAG: hypothetical protein NZ840_13245 [Anaerolineales bacterium]|nr:hypothetical protein [Anaerolineales bacterium]MDW8163000.1 hypothetical protein [Anaerolineales bacterium]
MLDKFWESLGGELAGEWLRRAFSPPFLFYLSGLGFYTLRHGWQPLWNWLRGLQLLEQVALLLGVLLGLILSALLTAQWRSTVLRWLEGYWFWPLRWLEKPCIAWQARRLRQAEIRLNALFEASSPGVARQRAELELFVHYFPGDPAELRPTRLGNILRAGETAAAQKYGLEAYACWPRLWQLLPAHLREDLTAVRSRLLTLAELWGMGLLSLVWTVWSGWALPFALLWMGVSYWRMLPVAMVYADLIESAFDLYRLRLYEAVGWQCPPDSQREPAYGAALSEFLWRGTLAEKGSYSPDRAAQEEGEAT